MGSTKILIRQASQKTLTSFDYATIIINQNELDPSKIISGEINGEGIRLIRKNSHRYMGKYINGELIICQLNDNDSNYYSSGQLANLQGEDGDVFMKLPKFAYKASMIEDNVWKIQFKYGSAPDKTWQQWEGNDLIGVYEASIDNNNKLRSISGQNSAANISFNAFKTSAYSKGDGFSLVKWKHHNIMAFLFYSYYGNTNAQEIVGYGTSVHTKITGQTDSLGMNDTTKETNGNTQSINFWGLENWWGNKFEFIDNIYIKVRNYNSVLITEDSGLIREIQNPYRHDSLIYFSKIQIGDYLDCFPTELEGASNLGYCDGASFYGNNAGSDMVMRRSLPREIATGGLVALSTTRYHAYASNVGTRLAYKGKVKEVDYQEFINLN